MVEINEKYHITEEDDDDDGLCGNRHCVASDPPPSNQEESDEMGLKIVRRQLSANQSRGEVAEGVLLSHSLVLVRTEGGGG